MEESTQLKTLYSFLQGLVYFTILVEGAVFLFNDTSCLHPLQPIFQRLQRIIIYEHIYFSKAFTFGLILLVSMGTRARKDPELDLLRGIFLPLLLGCVLFFGAGFFYTPKSNLMLLAGVSLPDALYMLLSLSGAVLVHMALDNISKHLQHRLLQDQFNVENESFAQPLKPDCTPYSVNIPMHFYYKKRRQRGWLNLVNPFRGTLLIGTPGSGKSISVVLPFIRQLLRKGFSMMVYDFKFPDLAKATYYHYLANRRRGIIPKHKFEVINFSSLEHSKRCNPLKPEYLPTLADAIETAEALLEALRKGDRASGAAQFFNQSAVNFLASCIYFLSRHVGGRYSSFPHVLSFISLSYDQIFDALFSEPELESMLSPFATAYRHKAFEQLEGQIGTLKINIGRLATKETFWILSGDDFDLKISNPDNPAVLVIANEPSTQSTNSACNALVINRITRLINTRGNLPCALVVDESPTLYIHRVENLIATGRSNRIAVLLGLQELPQLRQQYGRETADTICSVAANVLSGAARHKETLDWLEKLFGRVRQLKEGLSIDRSRTTVSMSEEMGPLIPASKIASLQAGELVGQVAVESKKYRGKCVGGTYHCKIAIDPKQLRREESYYPDLPRFYDFGSPQQRDQLLLANYDRIRNEVYALFAASKAGA
ncbi:type IV secretory system conjugative DNA transfer family protein [Pontibacter litorisediminis]|uniref:type IV secretory system conjugative DNA transfer family protein n=1 Tax=Pontibacter litorisediminis TaxID=1846260 RepID=UPI0023ED94BA|nr:type IV secretory system conjugative DNA transfer family protein [Pontibacter litorisediminis]